MESKTINLRLAGSKVNLAYAYINMKEGECTVTDYRRFIRRDKTYEGSFNGCEFYTAAKNWRQARGLPPISRVNKFHKGMPLLVSHGLIKKAKAKEPKSEGKRAWTITKEMKKWRMCQAALQEATEATVERHRDGTIKIVAVFGPDKK